jgi:putative transposase
VAGRATRSLPTTARIDQIGLPAGVNYRVTWVAPTGANLLYTFSMPYEPDIHHRRSIRLQGYDYSQVGAYYVTIATWQRAHLFGAIEQDVMRLNFVGRVVGEEWRRLAVRFPGIDIDAYIVMPNHFHGIIVFTHDRNSTSSEPLTLGEIIGQFKSKVTKRLKPEDPIWQRNYYEHIIRSQADMDRIRAYIQDNPRRWEEDKDSDLFGRPTRN